MRVSNLLALPVALLASVCASTDPSEHLHLQPLPGDFLYAGFTFNATTSLSAYQRQHFRFFPRSLAQILQYTHTAELHLRFSLGQWDDEQWGRRPRSGLREGGNGVELWAWIEDGGASGQAEDRWADLVNSLSGLFCASLNFIDSGKTTRPVLSFAPEGSLAAMQAAMGNATGRRPGALELRHGMLPHEVVCTENLTPFLKLLPCKGKAGISSLLDGHKLFDANWQTMSVDVRPVCVPGKECEVEIQQTVDMVLDLERSMRSPENRIPRPPPIEELSCDESKPYHGHDSCYPLAREGEMAWSVHRVFGRSIPSSCPLGGKDAFEVTVEVPPERTVEPFSESGRPRSRDVKTTRRSYSIDQLTDLDLRLPNQVITQPLPLPEPPIYVSRQMTGYGAERGGMHATIRNPHPHPQRIVYLESLPWFLRPYMHTLHVAGGTVEKMFYTPLLDRTRGTHLELQLRIPARTTVDLTYDFDKAILRYTEYPPDANRGFDVPAAVVRVLPDDARQDGHGSFYLRTTSLLLPLPTPDFSMPYNVIILTSTVIALGFGSIFNLLVRRFVLVEEVPASPLAARVKMVVAKVRERFGRAHGGAQPGEPGREVAQQHDVVPEVVVEEPSASSKATGATASNGTLKSRRKREK